MLYLEKDLFLENLEKRASPYQVAQTLYCRWENEKSNLQYFLRAGIECWYWLDNDIFWNNYLKQDELKDFAEIGLCGTAAVISPVGKIVDHGKEICFPSGMEEMGPVTKKLYETLTGIQMGRIEAPEGWIHRIL